MTAEELFWHRDAEHRTELVRGELRVMPFAHANEGDVVEVDDIVPGWRMPLTEIFESWI